jgi:hypothetical protein
VIEREKAGDSSGGVPLFEERDCPARTGSVVRRDEGGWKGVTAGVEEDKGGAELPTWAKELVGLSLEGRLKSWS